ncbi:hypothetical protein P775_12900 [Puniceibacterium antarcticum]|uniref:Uncharacterized protein n=1 Tax=Puniceibacterium antarcticum TaxID=1206336 RepID=A0A2G8RE19_9RHOB|nr:hypothetical protein P775_12900 [Puniceibacterium antarcticum]
MRFWSPAVMVPQILTWEVFRFGFTLTIPLRLMEMWFLLSPVAAHFIV